MNTPALPKFALGRVVATPGAIGLLQANCQSPVELLERHVRGDWGDLTPDDWELNDAALGDGGRILSAYRMHSGAKLWIITEADRSSTCILLPEEY